MTTATLPLPRLRARPLPDGVARILRVIEGWPGLTGDEIHERTGLRRFEVSVWLTWMCRVRLIAAGPQRDGHTTWRAK